MAERRILIASPNSSGSGTKRKLIAAGLILFTLVVSVFSATLAGLGQKNGNIALISINGAIGEGGQPFSGGTNPDDVISMIEQAGKDPLVKGILLEINSPGGSPVASEEIMKAVKDSKKPVVALIRDIGASGAYWVASSAGHVVASPVSLTGSVGVRSDYLQFSEFLSNYGIQYERLISGQYKDMGSPYRNLTDNERTILLAELAKTHNYFLQSVAENRHITDNESLGTISTARIFLGSEAKDLGLVDELGGKKEAEQWLRQQTNTTDISYVSYEKKSLFGLGSLLSEQASKVGKVLGVSFAQGLTGNSNGQRIIA